MIRKIIGWTAAALVVGLIGIQFVPVQRDNPVATADGLAAPAPVAALLRRSCYDCHSDETRWPWYSRLAPVSWLVARDVRLGRAEVNFSRWQSYAPAKRLRLLDECAEQIEEGEMPLKIYLVVHRDAAVAPADRDAFRTWADEQGPAADR